MSTFPGRRLVTAGFVLWAVSVLYVLGCLVAPSVVGDTACELVRGSSVLGEVSRNWLPPGTTCTYDLSAHGLPDVVVRPSPLRLLVLGVAVAGLPVLLYLRRLLLAQPKIGSASR